MKKIDYHQQESDLLDRLQQMLERERNARRRERQPGRVTEPATAEQLGLLAKLGIYPKWQATRYEAEEMICDYKLILGSVNRIP